jgi:cytidyltransferase-like protein
MSGERRVGLFGGSFDPIHQGHIAPVQMARQALAIERVLYLPTAHPPHKPEHVMAPPLARYAMVELALLGQSGLYASSFELTHERPAYTIDTVAHFRRELPGCRLFLLIGSDSSINGCAGVRLWRRSSWWCSPAPAGRSGRGRSAPSSSNWSATRGSISCKRRRSRRPRRASASCCGTVRRRLPGGCRRWW